MPMRCSPLIIAASFAAAVLLRPTAAHALESSTRGPFYIQGIVAGIAFQDRGFGAWFHQDIEFGFHTTGRHDGFVIGVRQGFDLGDCSAGETVARLGFDIAIPFSGGKYEMTIAPYGVAGLNYLFPCGTGGTTAAGVRFGGGIELKFFVYKGLYVLVRPAETTGAEYVDLARVFFHFDSGVGLGFAF